jgi:hypothetical protein
MAKYRAKRSLLNEDDVIKILRAEIARAGSQTAWAKRTGADRAVANSTLHGKRSLPPTILPALELKKVVAYSST